MIAGSDKLRARLILEPIEGTAAPGAVLDALDEQPDPVMLDSAAFHGDFGRYSVIACRPIEVLTLREGALTDSAGRVLGDDDAAIWAALDRAFTCVELTGQAADPDRPPYGPGWFGYFGYELGRHVEALPGRAVRDTALPDVRLGFYDAVAVYDAQRRRWQLACLRFDDPPPGAGLAGDQLRRIVMDADSGPGEPPPRPGKQAEAAALPIATAQANFTPDEYRRAVARCIEYIAAGDIFQVNLSQRFCVRDAPHPRAIYRALRRRNPAWYAAYMRFEAAGEPCAVLSSSPELFMRLRGRDVLTRPIKGTRPRIGNEQVDRAAAADLLASEKDNAELAMIIDLLRNDLGRVCSYGSIRVVEPRRLETHPTVFHLVGSVVGRLRDGVGPAQLLRAAFPGGSISGAPKIRAMQIIDELEPSARGVYTGCIGTVGPDGNAELNIAIRTIICQGNTAYLQVGGGIVADSTPQGEYQETLDKARAMLEAIQQARNDAG